MNINAENIQKKEFHVVFKGYKPEEVDKFLDILAVEFDKLLRTTRELQDNLERLKYEGDKESSEMKKVIQEALVSAHRIAEDIKQKAEKEAEELVRTRVVEEEETCKKLLSKKSQLESDIRDLTQEYESFKEKIARLVDDFKEAASRLGEGKFLNISRINGEEFDVGSDIKSDVERIGINENISKESKEEKEIINPAEDEFEVFKDTKKVNEEEEPEAEDLEESRMEEPLAEKEDEKDEDEEERETGKRHAFFEDSAEVEETEDDYKPKRVKKKIDIANPDIINDFFKTDED